MVVKALCYKPDGAGYKPDLQVALDPGAYSAFNRNVYQKQKNNVSG
jgi:hypothetical protein